MTFDVLQEGKRSLQAFAQVDLRHGDLIKFMSYAGGHVSGNAVYETQLNVGSCATAADAVICAGINIGSTTSGNLATIYLDGIYVTTAADASTDPGEKATCSLDPQAAGLATTTNAGSIIGTFLSTAASGEEVVLALNI